MSQSGAEGLDAPCPYPRPVPWDFTDCPAFMLRLHLATDIHGRQLPAPWTCAHLLSRRRETGGFYAGCALGTKPEKGALGDRPERRAAGHHPRRPGRAELLHQAVAGAGSSGSRCPPGSIRPRRPRGGQVWPGPGSRMPSPSSSTPIRGRSRRPASRSKRSSVASWRQWRSSGTGGGGVSGGRLPLPVADRRLLKARPCARRRRGGDPAEVGLLTELR
jgi:hypothetical protein